MTLRSLLVDFNSYFASVEQQVESRLRGRPLGVVPMLADTTVCIAASVEAKKFGVKVGESYWTLGSYDVVAIFEAPDDASITAMALALGSGGNVRT